MSFDYDEFDPLADDEQEEELTIIGADLELETSADTDKQTPRERLEELIREMPGQRQVLLGIIAFCREPRFGSEVDEKTLELKEHNYSIYSPVNLRELLEKTGTLEYTPADEPEEGPAITEEKLTDGVSEYELEYLEVQEKPQGTWKATADGIALLDEQDPAGDFKQLLIDDLPYRDIYKNILRFCSEEGGHNVLQIDALIKDEPLLQQPRKYGGYFIERLEKCEALLWKGTWVTSPLGKTILEDDPALLAAAE